jgi:hypothetical protein
VTSFGDAARLSASTLDQLGAALSRLLPIPSTITSLKNAFGGALFLCRRPARALHLRQNRLQFFDVVSGPIDLSLEIAVFDCRRSSP